MAGAWIEIRRNSDGVVRRYRDDLFDPHDGSIYQWTDGNYSCDCNREIFFTAVGEEDCADRQCGMTAYTVIRAICDNGEIVQIDDEERTT